MRRRVGYPQAPNLEQSRSTSTRRRRARLITAAAAAFALTISTLAVAPTASAAISPPQNASSTTASVPPKASTPVKKPAPISTTTPAGKVSARALCSDAIAKDQARCFALVMERNGIVPNTPAPTGLSPADIRDAYKLPADATGAGMTVGIVVAYDAPTAEADLVHYRAQFGLAPLAAGQFKKIDQHGGTNYPAPDAGWAGEAALDVDAITSVAPAAKIVLVVANSPNFDDLGQAVNTAVAAGAEVVNNSYGTNYTSTPAAAKTLPCCRSRTSTTTIRAWRSWPAPATVTTALPSRQRRATSLRSAAPAW